MADTPRDLIILGFRMGGTYTKRGPRHPDGTPGGVIEDNAPEYWVKYANRGMPQSAITEERIRHLDPENVRFGEGQEASEKQAFFAYRWAQIQPAFEAWVNGQALPEYGIPLAAWPALNADQVKAFMSAGVKSVEDVRDLHESQIGRIRLPNVRELKRLAGTYLESLSGKEITDRLDALETENVGLREQLAAAMQLLEESAKAQAETVGGKKPAKAA